MLEPARGLQGWNTSLWDEWCLNPCRTGEDGVPTALLHCEGDHDDKEQRQAACRNRRELDHGIAELRRFSSHCGSCLYRLDCCTRCFAGLPLCTAHYVKRADQPATSHHWLSRGLRGSAGPLRGGIKYGSGEDCS